MDSEQIFEWVVYVRGSLRICVNKYTYICVSGSASG